MGKLCSIIITHYDEDERCLRNLLDCFMMQKTINFDKYEIIIVNDGGEKAKEIFKELYDNYFLLNIKHYEMDKNYGVSHCRNFGIDKCEGEYFTFIDCDDLLYSNVVLAMFEAMNRECDLLEFDNLRVDENGVLTPIVNTSYSYVVCYGKFYRHDVQSKYNIRFVEGLPIFEDTNFVDKFKSVCQNIIRSENICIVHQYRVGSESYNFNREGSLEKELEYRNICEADELEFYESNKNRQAIINMLCQMLSLIEVSRKAEQNFYTIYSKNSMSLVGKYSHYLNEVYGDSINISRLRTSLLGYVISSDGSYNKNVVDMSEVIKYIEECNNGFNE